MLKVRRYLVAIAMIIALLLASSSVLLADDEDVKYKVASIEILGNENISTEEIKKMIGIKPGDEVTEDMIQEEIDKLAESGYFVPERISVRIMPSMGGSKITIEVVEYPVISSIVIEGSTVFTTEELLKKITLKVGAVLNTVTLKKDIDAILDYYNEEGYSAYVEPSLTSVHQDDKAILKFKVVERRVNKVKFEGYSKTKPHIIEREIRVKEGELLNIEAIQNDMRRIYNLGIFDDVKVSPEPVSGSPDLYDITYIVKERKTGSATAGATWSSADGLIGYLEIAEENFLGNHQTVNLRWSFGEGKNNYEMGFYEPRLLGSYTSFGFNIFDTKLEELSYLTEETEFLYDQSSKGWYLTIGRPLDLNTRAYLVFNWRDTLNTKNAEDTNEEDLPAVLKPGEIENVRSFSLSVARDLRDNFMNPSTGYKATVTGEFGMSMLGGDSNFQKITFDTSRFFKLRENHVIGVHLATGFGFNEISENNKYRIGGSDSVRGYDYGEFTGRNMAYGNLEYRFKIMDNLYGVAFYDIGGTWNGSLPPLSTLSNEVGMGYGAGVRINTPLGLIRIDYGVSKEGAGRTYFGFGHTF